MRVCFVLPSVAPSGGTAVVLGHAERLMNCDGFQVDVLVAGASRTP
jgi:hypothetical protein